MRETKRRRTARISTPPTNHEIEQAFRAIQVEGDGVYMLTLVSPVGAPRLFFEASDGNRIAHAQLEAIEHMLELAQRDPAIGPLCLLCGCGFGRNQLPVLFGFLQAHRDDPTQLIANAICAECCAKHPTDAAIERAIIDYLRAPEISNLRVLPQPLSEAGHA